MLFPTEIVVLWWFFWTDFSSAYKLKVLLTWLSEKEVLYYKRCVPVSFRKEEYAVWQRFLIVTEKWCTLKLIIVHVKFRFDDGHQVCKSSITLWHIRLESINCISRKKQFSCILTFNLLQNCFGKTWFSVHLQCKILCVYFYQTWSIRSTT